MVRYKDELIYFLYNKEEFTMAAIATSLIGYTVKAVIFAALAYAGIICGKKFRDKKDAERA